MFWQSKNELDALAKFRADRDRRLDLMADLADFYDIFWSSNDHQTKAWAQLQIKSIKHELNSLLA
tara:strand:- start:1535 stop:1729 length:195 start_codon:yes stop_codon:yes gene_type:complete